MPSRRRPPQDFLREITVQDDGVQPIRRAELWSRNKLGILASYLRAYAIACRSAGRFYFVDAMSGPGLYHFPDSAEFVLGSTLIALRTQPSFHKVLSMDIDPANCAALARRVEPYGDRAVVVQGDANLNLVGRMADQIARDAPVFVFLDPEGTELRFQTVDEVARFRSGPLKCEILVLLASSFLERLLPNSGELVDRNVAAINQVLPFSSWQELWEQKRAGEISAEDERRGYAARYERWLKEHVGYAFTASRPVTRPNSKATVYQLIFATDHPAGDRIMTDVFGTMRPNQPMQRLRGFD